MIDFPALQQAVKAKLDEDRAIHIVEAEADDLEKAVAEAATLLGVPIRHLEYEIVAQRTQFFGIGENRCKIRAFERPDMKRARIAEELEADAEDDFGELELINDKDGAVCIQRRPDGVYLKVTAPEGEGRRAAMRDAEDAMAAYGISGCDLNAIKHALKQAAGRYIRVGDYENSPLNDATARVDITDGEMRAYLTVSPPQVGGCDLTYENYIEVLRQHSVIFGINEPFLKEFADRPIYRQRVCVATAKKAIDGMDSYLEYYFETDQTKVRFVENNTGQVNFKELNIIQNVLQDEKLAKKNDAEPGVDGCTVTGKMLFAKQGKDAAVTLGQGVRFAEDGHTIVADINGQVVFTNGKINVEKVYVVDGSVNLKTGNIVFLGNVIVTGNVEEGFSVKASGNIEVNGTVNKAALTAEGDIIVNQGITGKEGVSVETGKSVWAKFIENATIEANDMVVVSDGIINSVLFASKRVICQGKRASILGGIVRAGEEINAKQIGSPSGNTETVCEVGYDPKTKQKIEDLRSRQTDLQAEYDDIQLNLQTMANIKKQRGSLPEDKEAYFVELVGKLKATAASLEECGDEIKELREKLQSIQAKGRVSASAKIYPGVVIGIRDQRETVRTEYKAVTFILDNEIIRAAPYEDTNIGKQKTAAKSAKR